MSLTTTEKFSVSKYMTAQKLPNQLKKQSLLLAAGILIVLLTHVIALMLGANPSEIPLAYLAPVLIGSMIPPFSFSIFVFLTFQIRFALLRRVRVARESHVEFLDPLLI